MKEVFKYVPIVHDKTLLRVVIQFVISSFVAHQLAKESRKPKLSRFCADRKLEIEHGKDNRGLAILHARETI